MTDIWDELWKEIKLETLGYKSDLDPRRVITYLERLKAEGDRLKDELRRYKNSFHIIKLAGGKEVELAQKLEAVKKYCLEVLEETKDFPNWMVIVRKLMRAILKILEAGGS